MPGSQLAMSRSLGTGGLEGTLVRGSVVAVYSTIELEALRELDKVSTLELEKLRQQLMAPIHCVAPTS